MKSIGLIIPCYNEEESLHMLYEALDDVSNVLSDYRMNMLFIDDGSTDKTLQIMRDLREKDSRVRYISFSRNFGKEAAMYAGFLNIEGEYIAVMDADMQDPPSLLPEMLSILEKGEYDSVATRRITRRGEPKLRSLCAKLFYKIINHISEADIMDGARDFRLMKRSMVDAIIAMSEKNRFSKGIFGWIGFRTYWYPYENIERVAGKTKWNFRALMKYSVDGIINFSAAPLSIVAGLGLLVTFISFVGIIVVTIRKLCGVSAAYGWSSMLCIIMMLGGIQLLCIGVVGQYIAKMYEEIKSRPHYIADEVSDDHIKRIG